ncbi:MAG: hypothetical protein ACK5LR_05255 [Mangrovibacterium sp.]
MQILQLIDTQLPKIVRKERMSEGRICLYSTGGYWVAFEHSAYMLSQLFPKCEVSTIAHKAYPFPVVMTSISDASLRKFSRQHIFSCDEAEYKELMSERIETRKYHTWRESITN